MNNNSETEKRLPEKTETEGLSQRLRNAVRGKYDYVRDMTVNRLPTKTDLEDRKQHRHDLRIAKREAVQEQELKFIQDKARILREGKEARLKNRLGLRTGYAPNNGFSGGFFRDFDNSRVSMRNQLASRSRTTTRNKGRKKSTTRTTTNRGQTYDTGIFPANFLGGKRLF